MKAMCALCRSQASDRLCGFDICGACRVGHVSGPAAALGFDLTSRRYSRSNRDSTTHYLEITVRHPTAYPLDVTFRRQESAPRWLRWLLPSGDPEVGDALFDDHVFVSADASPALDGLISDEGVQSAVMEITSMGWATVSPGCVVATRGRGDVTPDEPELLLPTVLLALHLETRAQFLDASRCRAP